MSISDGEIPSRSVERSAQILELFLRGRTELDLTDITELTGFSRTTAHRYCASLRGVGYLRYDSVSGRYGLGARMIELGAIAIEGLPLAATAEPYIQELVHAIDRTVVMTVWDGQAPVIVRTNDNTSTQIRISVRVGASLPVFESAQGLTYLAHSERIRATFSGRPELAAVEPKLAKIHRQGVCIQPPSPGLVVVSVPIFSGGDVPGTLAVIGTKGTVSRELDSPMVSHLRAASSRVSRALATSAAGHVQE